MNIFMRNVSHLNYIQNEYINEKCFSEKQLVRSTQNNTRVTRTKRSSSSLLLLLLFEGSQVISQEIQGIVEGLDYCVYQSSSSIVK